MKNLRKIVSCLLVVLILLLLPIPSIGVSASTNINKGNYVIISNESVNPGDIQSTGTLNFSKVSSKNSYNQKLDLNTYPIDVVIPVDPKLNKTKMLRKNTKVIVKNYQVGNKKDFWVQNLETNQYDQIEAELLYSGSKAYVWVHNSEITKEDAEKLGKEFEEKIYPIVRENFGQESDVDSDGHINILCFDIQDGFGGSGGYIAGYFNGNDLYKEEDVKDAGRHSNELEIFYIDTYPTMGLVKNAPRDVTAAYSTLAHEFQHMVNFNRNVLIEENSEGMDTWLDEALSMAAEHIYSGVLNDRIQDYNNSEYIKNGHSLLDWNENGDVLSNYALSYLFGQYIRIQAGKGNSIFKEIIQDKNNDYQAVESIIKKYIDPNLTFGKMMTNFRIALLLNNSKGLYGFKGESGFEKIEPRFYTGGPTTLASGGAIVKEINSNNFTVPSNKGKNITYTHVQIHKLDLKVNEVYALDKVVKGTTKPDATVYVKKGSTTYSGKADKNGNFAVTIPQQSVSTKLTVYSEDEFGNLSDNVTITVKPLPAKPTVNAIADNATKVTGKAEAGSTVYVKAGTKQIGKGTADSKGNYSITIPKQKAGTVLTVYAVDKAGNKSAESKITVVDKTPPAQPKVNTVGDNVKKVTGKAEAGATIYVKAGSKQIGKGTANSKGDFSVAISAKQKAGTTLTIYAVDKAGNKSKEVKIKVVDKTPPAAPTVNKVTSKTKKVTGKAEKNATIYIYRGSKLIGKGTVSSKGTFSVKISAQKKGTSLKVYAIDKAKNKSAARTVKVK